MSKSVCDECPDIKEYESEITRFMKRLSVAMAEADEWKEKCRLMEVTKDAASYETHRQRHIARALAERLANEHAWVNNRPYASEKEIQFLLDDTARESERAIQRTWGKQLGGTQTGKAGIGNSADGPATRREQTSHAGSNPAPPANLTDEEMARLDKDVEDYLGLVKEKGTDGQFPFAAGDVEVTGCS